jgi:DNA-binding NtrC family response regulator
MNKPRILVVDDDRVICNLMRDLLEMESYSFQVAGSVEEAHEAMEKEHFDILVSDIYLGDGSGLSLIERMKAVHPEAEVVIMTAQGSLETAVEAVRKGAFDYISKPFARADMLGIFRRIEEKLQVFRDATLGSELADTLHATEIVGTHPRMIEIYKKLAKVARIDSPVLVLGESGSGKELVARAVHSNSERASAPFVVINCGALPETLLESELFGHERGSFTGANASRKGLIETGEGGTVFLDEISETSLGFQVKLLRVIQEREIRRVGSNETMTVDIRVIAATNRDLRQMVRLSQFREDLFHRLNVFTIALPALRERQSDIPLLASHYLKTFSEKYGKSVRLTSDAIDALKGYAWPGNVRELKNVMEKAIAFNNTGLVAASEMEFGESEKLVQPVTQPAVVATGDSLDDMERQHIVRILRQTGGNKKKAAEILGIERRTLYNKAKRLGIDFGSV